MIDNTCTNFRFIAGGVYFVAILSLFQVVEIFGEDFQNRPVKAMKKLNNFEKGKKN